MPPPNRILVIDDEPSVTDALAMVLGELGHHIDSARTGAEAKELLRGSAYDLVFTDVIMPGGVSGFASAVTAGLGGGGGATGVARPGCV